MMCGAAMAGERPGKATVDWISESAACQPGKPLQTAIRMIHDPGWHSYWLNPGENGIKTTVEWKLPPGWKTGGLGYPEPARFLTSDLAGFGYAGTVMFAVAVTPPEDFTGTARLTAVVSWLACGENGCVPGKAEIHLDLAAGDPKPTPESREIRTAFQRLPRPVEKPRLVVKDLGKTIVFSIESEPGAALDLDDREAFPATPDVMDPRKPVRFAKHAGQWTAEAAKSEYAVSAVKQLTLVIASTGEDGPLEFSWRAP